MKKQQADLAIQLALHGRWTEAVAVNRALIEGYPNDVDAHNRLGKALTELGHYAEAREAYEKALALDPLNTIARKNLGRLSSLSEEKAPPATTSKLSPHMFIEETGKTGLTQLVRPDMSVAARMTAGDQVRLERDDGRLIVQSEAGQYVGEIEARLAKRLIKLMEAGNQYVGAISALSDSHVRLFIRETYQHPSQTGKLSFPPSARESVRPYIKERLLRKDSDISEEYYEEGEEGEDWEPDGSERAEDVIYGLRRGQDRLSLGGDEEEE